MKQLNTWLSDSTVFGKFVSPDTLLAVLNSRSLRWSRPAQFNDPFDFQLDFARRVPRDKKSECIALFKEALLDRSIPIKGEAYAKKLVMRFRNEMDNSGWSLDFCEEQFSLGFDLFCDRFDQSIAEMSDELAEMCSSYHILCTSKAVDQPLMWSHYSGGHSGAFLLFKANSNTGWEELNYVNYQETIPDIWKLDNFAKVLAGREKLAILSKTRDIKRALLTKSSIWSYEQERRMIRASGVNCNFEDVPFERTDLLAIIFGCRTEPETENSALSLLGRHFENTKIFSAKKATNRFELEFSQAAPPPS